MRRFFLLSLLLCLACAHATVADGDRAVDRGDYETAIAEYQAAYELRDSNVEALYKLARAKTYLAGTLSGAEAQRLYEEAVDHARAAVVLDPEEAEAHMELSRALGRLAQFKGVLQSLGLAAEVKSELETTLDIDPSHAGALHALALWHLNVPWIAGGRVGQVRPLFEEAIALEPNDIVHRVAYAESLIELGDEGAAKVQLEAALGFNPANVRDEEDLEKARGLLTGLE